MVAQTVKALEYQGLSPSKALNRPRFRSTASRLSLRSEITFLSWDMRRKVFHCTVMHI